MRGRLVIRRVSLALIVIGWCLARATGAGGAPIKPGAKIKVVNGPAAVKVGKKTLATVESGTDLTALKVKGSWVKVTIQKDGNMVTGWVHRRYLKIQATAEITPAKAAKKGAASAIDQARGPEASAATGGHAGDKEVDLLTFLTAYRDGKAERYKGLVVKGAGLNCNGDTKVKRPNGRQEVFFVLSPFACNAGGKMEPINSFKEQIHAALKKKQILQIVLYGRDLKPHPESDKKLRFSGTFQGEYMSVPPLITFGSDVGQPMPMNKAPILRDCQVSF